MFNGSYLLVYVWLLSLLFLKKCILVLVLISLPHINGIGVQFLEFF
jgi:hypothetical protein